MTLTPTRDIREARRAERDSRPLDARAKRPARSEQEGDIREARRAEPEPDQ